MRGCVHRTGRRYPTWTPGVCVPSELVARLEAASVGNAALSARFEVALGLARSLDGGGRVRTLAGNRMRAKHWTTDLNILIGVVPEVLPGHVTTISVAGSGFASIEHPDPCGPCFQAVAPTPALALCIAILKAIAR